MDKRIKKIICIVIVLLLIIVLCFVIYNKNNKKDNKDNNLTNVSVKATDKVIESSKYNIINGNLYYLYSEDEDDSFIQEYDDFFKIVSEYLNNNYSGINILIGGIFKQKAILPTMDEIIENEEFVNYVNENNDTIKYDHYMDVYQIQDGIVLINKEYRIYVDYNGSVSIEGIESNPFMVDKIDQSNFISVSDALKIVTAEINSNLEELRIDSIDSLSGTERLEFDGTNTYYYYKIGSSYIKINALNGEIIDKSIFNREYSVQ